MKNSEITKLGLSLLLILLGTVGCDKSNTLQTPLPVMELPAAIEKAFSKANPEVKGLANEIIKSVQAKDYAIAFLAIQHLSGEQQLTKEQVSTLARSRLTVNELLQSAEAKGDDKAAATLNNYRLSK